MDRQDVFDRLFVLSCAGVAAVTVFPPAWFWTETLPGTSRWLTPIAIVLTLAVFPGRRAERHGAALEAALARVRIKLAPLCRSRSARLAAACGVFLLIEEALFGFRSEFVHGDSINVMRFVDQGDWFHKRAPLSIAAMQALHSTLGAALDWSAEQSVQRASALAGACAAFAAAHLARTIGGPCLSLQLGVFAATLSTSASLLFFGYIEHYGVSSAAALWALALGVRAIDRETSPRAPALCATLAALIHGAMATLAVPALFIVGRYAWLRRPDTTSQARWTEALVTIGLCMLLTAIVIALMNTVGYRLAHETGFGGSDRRMFVPWTDLGGYTRYTLFSTPHFHALLNQWLLTLPAALTGLPLFGVLWLRERRGSPGTPTQSAVVIYTLLCGTGYLALTAIWNPDLGPLPDWDLFAPPGLLASAALATLVVCTHATRPGLATRTLLLITGVNLSRAIPWIAVNCFMA
jgi:hypothetical protein